MKNKHSLVRVTLFVAFAFSTVFCSSTVYTKAVQVKPGIERDHDIVPEDYGTLASVRSFDVSRDGKKVVYSENRWDEASDRITNELWLVDTKSRQPKRLTFDAARQHGNY